MRYVPIACCLRRAFGRHGLQPLWLCLVDDPRARVCAVAELLSLRRHLRGGAALRATLFSLQVSLSSSHASPLPLRMDSLSLAGSLCSPCVSSQKLAFQPLLRLLAFTLVPYLALFMVRCYVLVKARAFRRALRRNAEWRRMMGEKRKLLSEGLSEIGRSRDKV